MIEYISSSAAAMIVSILSCSFMIAVILIVYSNIVTNKQKSILLEKSQVPQIDVKRTNCRELVELSESTISLMNLINQIVATEVGNMMLQYKRLAKRYDYINLDKDAEKVATTVFNNINWDSYKKREILVKEEYLLKYISDQTIIQILDYAREMNVMIPELQA